MVTFAVRIAESVKQKQDGCAENGYCSVGNVQVFCRDKAADNHEQNDERFNQQRFVGNRISGTDFHNFNLMAERGLNTLVVNQVKSQD